MEGSSWGAGGLVAVFRDDYHLFEEILTKACSQICFYEDLVSDCTIPTATYKFQRESSRYSWRAGFTYSDLIVPELFSEFLSDRNIRFCRSCHIVTNCM